MHRELNARVAKTMPGLTNTDARLREMDQFEGYKQVITIIQPALECVVDKKTAIELARIGNDEMAEMVLKYPNKFVAAGACLPMNDIGAALKEAERAIEDLKFKGVQLFTPVNEKPLDSPEFLPLYEMMVKYDLPIWLHPTREPIPDYIGEESSKYGLSGLI